MWKQLIEFFTKVFTLAHRLERQEKALEQQQKEIRDIHEVVHRLALEQQRAAEREAYERKLLLLEIENRLLKEKLQLPPRPEDKQGDGENKK